MGICYYLHPVCDHYSTKGANVTAAEFSQRRARQDQEVTHHLDWVVDLGIGVEFVQAWHGVQPPGAQHGPCS